jgi:hypothetical protein
MSTTVPKTAGLVTIRYIVASTLNRLGDYNMKQYKRMSQICIECFSEELSMFHIGNTIEVVYLHMSLAKTVNLPSDYIDYRKIGYPINGKLRVITRNDNILLPRTFDDTGIAVGNTDDGVSDDTIISSDVVFFSDHVRNGIFVGGLYGLPGGVDEAYYRIDMERRQIVFSGITPRSEIVLEYIGTGLKPEGGSLIPRECIAPLRNYILWQMVENDPRIAYNEKERRMREYDKSIEALRSFKNAFTAEEYTRMLFSTYRQSPKR